MRVAFISMSPQDYAGAGGRTRIISECRYAIGSAHQVEILCLVPLRKYLRWPALRRARRQLELDSGRKVVYRPRLPTFGLGPFRRIAETWNRYVLRRLLDRGAYEVAHCHGAAAAAAALSIPRGGERLCVVADIHGASAEEYRVSASHSRRRYRELKQRDRAVVEGADLCVFVSHAMASYYISRCSLNPRDYVVVPCATRDVSVTPDMRANARRGLGVEDKLVMAYVGSWRRYQLPADTVALFKSIASFIRHVHLLIITSHRRQFEAAIHEAGIDRTQCSIRSVEHAEVLAVLAAADAGFLLRSDVVINRVASPTKFAEYLVAGIPVITTCCVGDYSAMVQRERVGLIVDRYEATESVVSFLRDVECNRAEYTKRCQKLAREQLTWARARTALGQAYDRLGHSVLSPKFGKENV